MRTTRKIAGKICVMTLVVLLLPALAFAADVDATKFKWYSQLSKPEPLAPGTQASFDTISYKGGEMKIVYLPMGTQFNFHVALNVGIEDVTKSSDKDQLDSFMLGPWSGLDQAAQIGMLQDVTARDDVDGIILISFDEQALAPLVEQAVQAGKAVLIVNSDIKEWPTPIHGVIGVSQRKVNHALYDWSRTQLGDSPRETGVLRGQPGYLDQERSGGWLDGIKGSNWKVVSEVNGGWAVETGNTAGMDVLQANPKISVLYAANDYMAQGASLAAQELGRDDIYIFGYDGDVNALEDIYRGTAFYATTDCKPRLMGRLAALYMIDILNKKGSGGYINTPTEIVHRKNAGDVLKKYEDLYPTPSLKILKELGVK